MNRDSVQDELTLSERTVDASKPLDDEFDTNIHGPWMNRWEITHHNRHTQSLPDSGTSWDSLAKPGDKA